MSDASDEELVAALREGDMAAFDRLYARYERRLYGYICRIVGATPAADDLFQDVFLKVLRDRSYDPQRGRFAPWLFAVARNACLQAQRRERTREALSGVAAQRLGPAAAGEVEAQVGTAARVQAAMAALPEPQRQLILLKQLGELSYREIAGLLGVAEGTIKSRLHAATQAFRRLLTEGGSADEL
ncbi:MAG TPA: sigma-70 family RNA polymerase sigma factor [Nannocystis sp.]